MNKEFNFNKLIIAREYNKLTQNQLLSELKDRYSIKLLQSELSKIEKAKENQYRITYYKQYLKY